MTHIVTGQGRLFLSVIAFLTLAGMSAVSGAMNPSEWFVSSTRSAGMVLEGVEISGHQRTSRSDILARIDTDRGAPLMSIDLQRTQENLEALPWIKTARVSRQLPNRLMVDVSEREAFALWQNDGDVQLIDRDGSMIPGQVLRAFPGRVLFVGVGANVEAERLLDTLNITPELKERLQSAVWVGERRWDLIFEGGVRVKFPENGLNDAFPKSLELFLRLQREHQLLERDVTAIDLRVPGQMVLRLNPDARHLVNTDFTTT